MNTSSTWTCWRDASHTTQPHPTFGWPQCSECGAAPQYHERPAYVPDDLNLLIFVPTEKLYLVPGTAIVGVIEGGHAMVYYEGWKNGAMQYRDKDARGRWEAGLLHAAGRMVTAYPTTAKAAYRLHQVRAIGLYNPKTHAIILDDEEALDTWLNLEN